MALVDLNSLHSLCKIRNSDAHLMRQDYLR